MTTPKLYSATFDDVEKNVPIAVINKWVIRLDDLSKHFPERFTSLQPMRPVKADAVVIEGVSAEELRDAAEQSLKFTHLKEDNKPRIAVMRKILAQLSPRPEAREEQVSLGEVVKVTIELSEEDAFEARFHDEDLANNRIGEQICYQVAEQLRTLNPLTPPVELPEPNEPELYGTTVLRSGYAFQKNHVFSHYGIPAKEWFRSGSDTAYTWDDIKDGAEIIYDPTEKGLTQ